MGKLCTSAATCCSDIVDRTKKNPTNVKKKFLEEFQNQDIPLIELKDTYDQLYRVCSEPFNSVHVVQFFNDLKELESDILYKNIKKNGEMFEIEAVPVEVFMRHFMQKQDWQVSIWNQKSALNIVIQLDGLFLLGEDSAKVNEKVRNILSAKGNSKGSGFRINDSEILQSPISDMKDNMQILSPSSSFSKMTIDQSLFSKEGDNEGIQLLNLTNLKVFALLMCPGMPEEKAGLLFDLAYGHIIQYEKKQDLLSNSSRSSSRGKSKNADQPSEMKIASPTGFSSKIPRGVSKIFNKSAEKQVKDVKDKEALMIDCDNPRLKEAIKLIVYLAETYPKKNRNSFKSILKFANMPDIEMEENQISDRRNDEPIKTQQSNTWKLNFVQYSEEHFDSVFESIYEKEFIDCIFEDLKSLITRDNFIEAMKAKSFKEKHNLNFKIDINPFDGIDKPEINMALQGTATWLFKPRVLREIFKKHVKLHMNE